MLVIRLRRVGKKNRPSYRVVVAEHSYPVNGKFTADLGFYNPHTKQTAVKADEAKVWMDKGAKPSNTVAKLLEKEKIKHAMVTVVKKSKKAKKKVEDKPTAPAAAPAVAPDVEAGEAAEEVAAESPSEEAAASEGEKSETSS
jgi:small subunit ribosomal protein S16